MRPVLLVHGILGNRHLYWNVFRHRLRQEGVRFHEVFLPAGLLGDLRIAAGFLKDKVEASLRGDDAQKVDLVCHSAGGLVARYYLKYLDGHQHVDRLVMMGTPNLGTHLGLLFPFLPVAITRQSRPGSHFLQEVNGPGAIPPGVRITNIWSATDGIVIPARNAVLPGAENIELRWIHHWGMLLHKNVYEAVMHGLGRRDDGPGGGVAAGAAAGAGASIV